jgi:hypothetical protein
MAIESLHHKQLPVSEDISLHKTGWIVQRIGWTLMFLFLVAALLGLFGEGPLSKRTLQSGNLQMKYEHFGRYEHTMKMELESLGENIRFVSLPQDYLKSFKVDKIVPEPAKQVASPGYISYVFEGEQNDEVTFYMEPSRRKNAEGIIKVNGSSFLIKQIIYP